MKNHLLKTLLLTTLLNAPYQAYPLKKQSTDQKAREMAKKLVNRFHLGEEKYIQIKAACLQYLKGELSYLDYQYDVLHLLSGENAKLYEKEIQQEVAVKTEKNN